MLTRDAAYNLGVESSKARIVAEAHRLGFEAVAVARADVPLDDDFARYESFLAQGMQGEMSWLANTKEARRRVDGEEILPSAKSVICLARRYAKGRDEEQGTARAIARYARGRDYHTGLRKKIRQLAAFVRRFGAEARPICDDAPLLERAWAARAGLGFVGKNGLLIVPGTGSFVLLGEVVTTLDLEPDSPIPERCGTCTRCLDACPTDAFAAPFVLDARKCISYLTIEHRSQIDPSLREGIGEHLFGCDDCQSVCPFNASSRDVPIDPRFEVHPRWHDTPIEALLSLDEARYAEVREGTPVSRATRVGLARNAAIVLGNRREGEAALREAQHHDSEIVREAADWALARIKGTPG